MNCLLGLHTKDQDDDDAQKSRDVYLCSEVKTGNCYPITFECQYLIACNVSEHWFHLSLTRSSIFIIGTDKFETFSNSVESK